MEGYKFFQNKECEYYPCHVVDKTFSCLFCYCPLYFTDCTEVGEPNICHYHGKNIKDCSACIFPHEAENYSAMMGIIVKKLRGEL